jgi:hypothetical protein
MDAGAGRGSRGHLAGEEGRKPVEQQARAVLALGRVLEAVEERTVLGEDQVRTAAVVGAQLDGR